MKMRIMVPAVLALALTAAAVISMTRNSDVSVMQASSITAAGVSVTEAWARATPPGASVGAVYVTIENRGGAADRIVSISSPAANSAMAHETIEENGVSTMREAIVDIGAGDELQMKPGGVHIMLMGLKAPLKEGETVSLTLKFEKAGTMIVEARVGPLGAAGPME